MQFLDHALALAAHGWSVFPCVRAPGTREDKRPLTVNGFYDATRDEAILRAWAAQWPDARVGVPTGLNGLCVVDLDVKHGKDGVGEWIALEARHGAVDTFTVRTDSGGMHLYYAVPPGGHGLKSTVDQLARGVDTRAEGGYVIAYPHVLANLPIAPVPAWLAAALPANAPRERSTSELPDIPRRAVEAREILAFATRLKAHPQKHSLLAMCRGEAWGARGGRDNAITRIFALLGTAFPDLDPEALLDWLEPARLAVEREDQCPTDRDYLEEKLWRALAAAHGYAKALRDEHARDLADMGITAEELTTIAKTSPREQAQALRAVRDQEASDEQVKIAMAAVVAAKPTVEPSLVAGIAGPAQEIAHAAILSALADAQAQAETKRLAVESDISRAFGTERREPYSADELRAMAPIDKRWILGTDWGYLLRAPRGYVGPFRAELVPAAARDILAPASTGGVRLFDLSETGVIRPRPATELVQEYGMVPHRTEYTLIDETSVRMDKHGPVLRYRALRLAEHEPAHSPEIEAWLRLLSGPREQAFLDWLATFLRLERPSCAVMLKAMPGVGKGLLVDGLSSLFADAKAVPFVEAISAYNGALTRSPLIVADETLAAPPGVNAVDEFKKLVGDSSFRVSDKYIKASTMRGCVRVLLPTNHHGGFKFGRELTQADSAALAQRVLVLEPDPTTADFLVRLGGRAHTESWVEGGALARHVLWLAQTRSVTPGGRFLVEGQGLDRFIASDSRGTAPLLRAIVHALRLGNESVHVEDKQVWVAKRMILEQWATLNPRDEMPDDMGEAWGLVCEPASSRNFRKGKGTVRRNAVKLAPLIKTVDALGLEAVAVQKLPWLQGLWPGFEEENDNAGEDK